MDGTIERAVGRVIVSMRENLGEELTIDDMARTAMFSKFHFSRVFQRVTGVSPGRFLSAIRFQEAKDLLVSTDLTVTDICHRVGYTSVGTFSSRFRRNVGVSPTAYRQLGGLVSAPEQERTSLPEQPTATVHGEVRTPRDDRLGLIFVGLFADRIPRGQPLRWTVLHRPGSYEIADVPQGTWYLVAHSVAAGLEHIMYGPHPADQILCVGQSGPIRIRPDVTERTADIQLRPTGQPDPPELRALLDVRSTTLGVAAA